jgi:hypothetical protein
MRDAAPNLGYRASCRDSAHKGKAGEHARLKKIAQGLPFIPAAWLNPESFQFGLTLELPGLRIHVPRKTEQRGDADRTGDDEYGQHLTPRNKLLRASLSDWYAK